MADGYFITPQDANQIEMLPGVHRRTMGITDEAMLCEFFLERDSVVPEHSHMNDQVGYVIYGRVEFTVGGEHHICNPGRDGRLVCQAPAARMLLVHSGLMPIGPPAANRRRLTVGGDVGHHRARQPVERGVEIVVALR